MKSEKEPNFSREFKVQNVLNNREGMFAQKNREIRMLMTEQLEELLDNETYPGEPLPDNMRADLELFLKELKETL